MNQVTFLLSLSKASFKLNILLLSLILAALLWAIDATRRRVFLLEELDRLPLGVNLCETKPFTWLLGHIDKSEQGKPAINSGYETIGGGASCPQIGVNGVTSGMKVGSECYY